MSEAPRMDTGLNRSFQVDLPSRGIVYDGKLPEGKLQLRPMTTAEEAILYNAAGSGTDKIAQIINSCVLTKGMETDDLLLTDRLYILIMLRTRSYGGDYEFPIRCASCGAQTKTRINIAQDLEIVQMSDGVIEPFEVTLPTSKKRVLMRFLRGKDESRIAKYSKRIRLQSSDPGDPSHIYRLALQITAIDGQEVKIIDAENFVRDLDISDSNEMRLATDELEKGVDTRVYPECRACGYINEMEMPFSVEFFRPSTRRGA